MITFLHTVSVDTYNSEDWQKLKAAVSALKNPVLDDSVLLEPSAIGQYLHTDYIRSQSTPSIANMTEEELEAIHSGNFAPFQHDYQLAIAANGNSHSHARRGSEGGLIHAYRVQVSDSSDPRDAVTKNPYSATSSNMIDNWVAGLPEHSRRTRSHTDPMRHLIFVESGNSQESPTRAKTLPNNVPLLQSGGEDDIDIGKDIVLAEDGSLCVVTSPVHVSPVHISPVHTTPSKRSSVHSLVSSPDAGADAQTRQSQSPVTPVTPTNSKLIKIFMSKVQKGEVSATASPYIMRVRFLSL